MRKIQTQTEIDKKKRRNQFVIGVVLVGLMVLSTLGYSLMSGDGGVGEFQTNENGIDFFRQNGRWTAEIDEVIFGFVNLPSEISNINVNISSNLGQYSGKPLYFVNPNEGVNEILINIEKYILRYQEACLENESCEDNLPVKNCSDNLIIFKDGNFTEVYQNENCVFIVGDTLMGTDAFLYKVLQIT